MAIVIIKDEYLTDIADAIRTKNGLTDTYKPSEMAAAISQIEGGVFTGATQYAIGYNSWTFVNPVQYDLSNYLNRAKIVYVDCATDGMTKTQLFAFHINADDEVTLIENVGMGTGSGLSNIKNEITAKIVGGILSISAPNEYSSGTLSFTEIQWSTKANIYYVQ